MEKEKKKMFHWQAPRRDYASRVVNHRRAVVLSKMVVVVYNQSTRSSQRSGLHYILLLQVI
jgi:hypothetical protein